MKFLQSKKAQLGMIEMKFFFFGLLGGIILGIAVVYLANKGILPFKLTFVALTPMVHVCTSIFLN